MAKRLPYVKADDYGRQRLTALTPTLAKLANWLTRKRGYFFIGERFRDHADIVQDVIGEAALLFPYCASQTRDDKKALSRAINVALSRQFTRIKTERRRGEVPLEADIMAPFDDGIKLADMLTGCQSHIASFGLDIAFNGLDGAMRNPAYVGVFDRRLAALRAAVKRQLAILLD
jgi:hypothetical protein